MSSPTRFGTSAHGHDRTDWIAEKNGYVPAPSREPSGRAESFGAGSTCSDCGLDDRPCACCLECGQVQERVMAEYERCAPCVLAATHECTHCGVVNQQCECERLRQEAA